MAAFKTDVPMFSEKVHTRFALKVTEPAKNIKVILKDSDKLNSKGNAIFYIIKKSAMRAQEKTTKKYNITISKLFQIVINLNEEQQMALLHHAEGLLVREKRTNIRKACDIPVNFAMDNRIYSNHIKNISRKGLFIETQRPLLVGDEILMAFKLEGFEKVLKMRGEVSHATRTGVGVEFKNVSPYIEEMIDAIVKRMNS